MSDTLTAGEAVEDLAETWEEQAGIIERLDPSDPKAKVLRTCSRDLRARWLEHAPDWVTLPIVQARTGWSLSTLRKKARKLADRALARKTESGEWEVRREAAIRIPVKEESADLDGLDLDEMARVLARDA